MEIAAATCTTIAITADLLLTHSLARCRGGKQCQVQLGSRNGSEIFRAETRYSSITFFYREEGKNFSFLIFFPLSLVLIFRMRLESTFIDCAACVFIHWRTTILSQFGKVNPGKKKYLIAKKLRSAIKRVNTDICSPSRHPSGPPTLTLNSTFFPHFVRRLYIYASCLYSFKCKRNPSKKMLKLLKPRSDLKGHAPLTLPAFACIYLLPPFAFQTSFRSLHTD